MDFIELPKILDSKQRQKELKKQQQNHPNYKMVKLEKSYYIVAPELTLSFEELIKSDILSEAIREYLVKYCTEPKTLESQYRNKIESEYLRYYEFAKFSADRGINRLLLLGKEREEPIEKIDNRKIGNNSYPYREDGANVFYNSLLNIKNEGLSDNQRFIYLLNDEEDGQCIVGTKFNLYLYLMGLPNLPLKINEFDDLEIDDIPLSNFSLGILKLKDLYKKKKRQFLNARYDSFKNYLIKNHGLVVKDAYIGDINGRKKVLNNEQKGLYEKLKQEAMEKHNVTDRDFYSYKKKDAYMLAQKQLEKNLIEEGISQVFKAESISLENIKPIIEVEDLLNDVNRLVEINWKNDLIENFKKAYYLERYIPSRDTMYSPKYENMRYFFSFSYFDYHLGLPAHEDFDLSKLIKRYFLPINVVKEFGDDLKELIQMGIITEEAVYEEMEESHLEMLEVSSTYADLVELNNIYLKIAVQKSKTNKKEK